MAGAYPKRVRITPFFDLALEGESAFSVDKIRDETVGADALVHDPHNDFERRLRVRGDDA